MFHSPHPQNARKEPSSKRTCIAIDKDSKHISITGNIFNGKGIAIRAEDGSTDIQTQPNPVINPQVIGPDKG